MNSIDFARSRAILVGTARYTHGLERMDAARNSLKSMKNLLAGPLCGWPAERVIVFKDKTTRDGLNQEIAKLIHDTTDVLLFYYVGHGQLLDGEHLGLALVDTHAKPEMRHSTSLRLDDLRTELKYRCRARVKLVILDCCFSGIATRNTQGIGLADQVRMATKVEGAYTLTASRASQKAVHQEGPDGLTYFTKIFAEVVRGGIPGAGAQLTLKDIHTEVTARFLRLDLPDGLLRPEPSVLAVDSAEEFAFACNALEAERPAAPASQTPKQTVPATMGPLSSREAEPSRQDESEEDRGQEPPAARPVTPGGPGADTSAMSGTSLFLDPPRPSRFQPFIRPGNTTLRDFNAADWSTFEDDALAVRALSGGRSRYVTDAARDISTNEYGYYDAARADRAIREARKQGIDKSNARNALLVLARRSSPPIPPGRIDIVQRGINRFARARQSAASAIAETSGLLHDFQRASGEGNRLDLAGDWAVERTQRLAQGLIVRAKEYDLTPVLALGYIVVLEALRVYSLNDLLHAHPFALIQVSQAVQIFLSHGGQDERLTAATIALELSLSRTMSTLTGDAGDILDALMANLYDQGITASDPHLRADQLAALIAGENELSGITGQTLMGRSRVG